MHDAPRRRGPAVTRRLVLLAAPALGLASLNPSRAQTGGSRWPPVFEAGRSQFTVVRPRVPVPPLRLQDLRGKDVLLAPKAARVTLINFWATWCAACRLDLPTIASLERSRIDGLDICAICTDTRDIRKIRSYLGGLAVENLACYVDAHGVTTDSSASVFRLVGMPITYLVGTSNHVEGYITGAPDWLSPAGARLLQFYREQA